jgi:hypothetical protein
MFTAIRRASSLVSSLAAGGYGVITGALSVSA